MRTENMTVLRKLAVAIGFIAAAVVCAHAQIGTSKTPTQLNTEVNQLWPDQLQGQLTPFNARQTLLDIIASGSVGAVAAKCDGVSDDSAVINAAIIAANAAGTRMVQVPSGICIVGSSVQMLSNVVLNGTGIGGTTIKLKNGANVDVIDGAANLFGGSPPASSTVSFAQLSNMTIDGNKANNTSGTCVGVVGYRNAFINLKIQNCPEYGLHTELVNDPAGPMESYYDNVLIDTTGKHGWWNNGPHDSNVQSFIVVDAGQATTNTWDGIFNDTHASFRGAHIHTWLRGASNRTRYGFNDSVAGGNNIVTSNFEGSSTAEVILQGNNNTFASTAWFAPWNGTVIVIKSAGNVLQGTVGGPPGGLGLPAAVGVILGQGGDVAASNVLDLNVSGNNLGAVDFTHSAGFNKIKIRDFQTTGPGFIGSPAATDDFDFLCNGCTSLASSFKLATPVPIGSGGTGDTGTGATAFTTSPTCGNGTVVSNQARSKPTGVSKIIFFQIDLTITAIGTTCAAAQIVFNLPATTASSGSIGGVEGGVTNKGFNCFAGGASTTMACRLSDNTNWQVNAHILGSGVFESQ